MGEGELSSELIERRRFLKRAATVAWAVPVVYTLTTGPAHAQVILCGTAVGGVCPNTPACPTPLPVCRTAPTLPLNQCGCFVST